MSPSPADRPGVVAPPPVIFAAGVLGGLALHWLAPIPLLRFAPVRAAGVLLVVLSVAWIALCEREFRRHETSINPYRPSTALIESGPFRRSRNPVYLGLAGIHLGIALAVSSLWIALALVPVLAVMRRGVIEREERYLGAKFGEAYERYRERVPRWL